MKLTLATAILALGACSVTSGNDSPQIESRTAEIETPRCWNQTLGWGSGERELGLTPAAEESLARGPQAVAVGPSGEVFVLDSVNGRVLGLTGTGARVVIEDVVVDAEDLAVGADGALAVHSPLRGKAWVFDPDGAPAGDLAVPRTFRSLVGISLDSSREIVIRSAYQETHGAGSPAAPKDLPTMLSQKREGAYQLTDGRGVAVRASEGVAELILLRTSSGHEERTRVSSAHRIPGEVTGAQIVGLAGDIACLRLERVEQPAEAIEVHRRAICMNATSGALVYESAMAAPSIYLPKHELSVGGANPVLASLKPSRDGISVEACEVLR